MQQLDFSFIEAELTPLAQRIKQLREPLVFTTSLPSADTSSWQLWVDVASLGSSTVITTPTGYQTLVYYPGQSNSTIAPTVTFCPSDLVVVGDNATPPPPVYYCGRGFTFTRQWELMYQDVVDFTDAESMKQFFQEYYFFYTDEIVESNVLVAEFMDNLEIDAFDNVWDMSTEVRILSKIYHPCLPSLAEGEQLSVTKINSGIPPAKFKDHFFLNTTPYLFDDP